MNSKNTTTSLLSILCVSLFPCLYLFFHNIGIATVNDLLGISGIIVLFAIGVFVLNYLCLRDIGKASLITNIVMCILLYFALIEKAVVNVLPMFYHWHIALICLFFIIQLSYFIQKKISSRSAHKLNQVMLFVFAGLILINSVLASPRIVKEVSQNLDSNRIKSAGSVNSISNIERGDLPNVYYFIFDEYAGYDSVKRYCEYDNGPFYESLEKMGFVTSKHSANGTWDTYTEIPNLLQLRRVNSPEMTLADRKENFKNPYLFALMKEHGYKINALDWSNYTFIDASQADAQMTSAFVSTYGTFTSYIIRNTAFYPFYGVEDQKKEISKVIGMFDYAMTSSKMAESGLFTIGYFSFPHVPYIVDENGHQTSASDRENLRDPVPYCKQHRYASKKIMELVKEILKNDPDSVIILHSDHGFRLPEHLRYWYDITDKYDIEEESPYMRNILNAVYFKGDPIEIEGLSGVNTLRVVLNELLDVNFEVTE